MLEYIKLLIKSVVETEIVEINNRNSVTVQPKQLHPLLKTLHDNKDFPLDFLPCTAFVLSTIPICVGFY